MVSHWAAGANAHGYSVAVIGYRLCPEARVGEIIDDVRAAALFLRRRFGAPIVACGHSAGGHLASALVATDWNEIDASIPAAFLRSGMGISGVFDLAPLIETEMNEQLRLDQNEARVVSTAYWPVRKGTRFEAWVGADESSEFLRQSRLIADRWSAAGAQTRYETIPGANHFTASAPLTDPESAMVAALVSLAASEA
jgi:arylformamidase